jgi:hypothetical protein
VSGTDNAAAGPVSVYDRLRRSDTELTGLLATGGARLELTAMFGAREYAALARLARAAGAARVTQPGLVLLLPGIMGTQLGAARGAGLPPDLLWLDPQDVIGGDLVRLRLPDGGALTTLGALPYSYLALQLRLRAAGFAVEVHEYDWRCDLRQAGAALAARLAAATAPVQVVAHSMGGLVARYALGLAGLPQLTRLVTLGTPHEGSYGAAQALRGTYPTVRRLGALDRRHDAETLAREVFSSFPSIHQLLPPLAGPERGSLLDAATWPADGPGARAELLVAARDFRAGLPAPDARCIAVCGMRQRTVTALVADGSGFAYEVDSRGDGTVPLDSAQLRGCDNYFVHCEHSALPRNPAVARALIDLLLNGRTTRLALRPDATAGRRVRVSDADLRATWTAKVDWLTLSADARREYLEQLSRPPPLYSGRRA